MTPEQQKLVTENLDVARMVVNKTLRRNARARLYAEDIHQEARLGLVFAAMTFDPSRGIFRAHAWAYARKYVNDFLWRGLYSFHPPREAKDVKTSQAEELPNPDEDGNESLVGDGERYRLMEIQAHDPSEEYERRALFLALQAELKRISTTTPANAVDMFVANAVVERDKRRAGVPEVGSLEQLGRQYGMSPWAVRARCRKVWDALKPWLEAA